LVVVDLAQLLLVQRPLDADTVQVFIEKSCAEVRDVSKYLMIYRALFSKVLNYILVTD